MKESRRHRWIMIGSYPLGDTRAMSVCRDCGLEVATHRVKSGELGLCAGKACEHQQGLSLISGDPQSLSSNIIKDAMIACAGCGKSPHVMIAHRNPASEITGWLFSCGQCFSSLIDHEVIIRPVVKGEAEDATEDTG